MIKRLIRKTFHTIGLDIRRYTPSPPLPPAPPPPISVRTENLKLYHTVTGDYWLPEDAKLDIVRNAIIANQIFDNDIFAYAKKYIEEGSVVLDVGANFGQMSVLFSQVTGNKGKVYSFEAEDFVFDILKKNIAENKRDNIIPVFGAVYDSTGEKLVFPIPDFKRFPTWGSYGPDYTNTQIGREVPTLTIDSLNIDKKVSFIKIDVQGGDLFVLRGAVNTIKKWKPVIIFEFENVFQDELSLNFQEYVDFVSDSGYFFAKIINMQNYLILPKGYAPPCLSFGKNNDA